MQKVVKINGELYGWSVNHWDNDTVTCYRPLSLLKEQRGKGNKKVWVETRQGWVLNPYIAGYITPVDISKL